MKKLIYALILSGLFFGFVYDVNADQSRCKQGTAIAGVGCVVPAKKTDGTYSAYFDYSGYRFTGQGTTPIAAIDVAIAKLTKMFNSSSQTQTPTCDIEYKTTVTASAQGSGNTYKVTGQFVSSETRTARQGYTCQSPSPSVSPIDLPVVLSFTANQQYTCPPDNFLEFKTYKVINSVHYCLKEYDPLPPLDCSSLKGKGASMVTDSFIAGAGVYTKENPPSCVTKTAKDANGNEISGDCKVVAKGWGLNSSADGTKQKWWPLAATFTGAACGEKESEEPPPDAPKCWETQNALNMCQFDPAEKCLTVNGVQQCEAGCGFINGDFFCKTDKEPEPPKKDVNKDKPLDEVDDNISNPDKKSGDMTKQDFKEINKGVETRISQSVTMMGNLENSVDEVDNTLKGIQDTLNEANSLQQSANSILSDIKAGAGSGTGSGDGDGDGDDSGECDPLLDKDCLAANGSPKSWWQSSYPDGFTGLLQDKQAQFQASEAYKAMTLETNIGGGGTQPNWNFCFNFGFADFGCKELIIPAWIWLFIKSCILFTAAITCRKLLIGG